MPAKMSVININPQDRFDQLEIFKYIKHAEPDDFPPSVMSDRNTVLLREDAKEWIKEWQCDRTDTVGNEYFVKKYEDDRGVVLTRTKWALRLSSRKGFLINEGLEESKITKLVNELVDFIYDKYDADNNTYIKANGSPRNKKRICQRRWNNSIW